MEWQRGWRPFEGKYVRYDAESGSFSCYSLDGTACVTASPTAPDAAYPAPRECRADGPDGDWCERAFAAKFATWFNYSSVGFGVRLSRSLQGHAMCESYDGKKCNWSLDSTDGDQPARPEELRPLVCGAKHAAQWGGASGYDTPGHWCNSREILTRKRGAELDGRASPRFFLAPWTSKDEPAWILRATVGKGASMGIGLFADDAKGRGYPYEQRVEDDGKVGITARKPFASIDPPLLDGRVTLALRVDARGRMHFHRAQDWTADILDSEPVWPITGLTEAPVPIAGGSVSMPHLLVFLSGSSTSETPDALEELLVTRKRRIPAD
ncbi:hypothetical protein [Roseateles sp.]|uniref:hypothetical protein n=1 Tax=Roseateles sp. TaxID=1971397 RepID=UPI0031E2A177